MPDSDELTILPALPEQELITSLFNQLYKPEVSAYNVSTIRNSLNRPKLAPLQIEKDSPINKASKISVSQYFDDIIKELTTQELVKKLIAFKNRSKLLNKIKIFIDHIPRNKKTEQLIPLLHNQLIDFIQLSLENLATKEQKDEEENSRLLKAYRWSEDGIDKIIAGGKFIGAIFKVIKFFAILVSYLIKPLVSAMSALGDLWGYFKAHIDKTRIARTTSKNVAAIRFARSATTITLALLTISIPPVTISLLVIGVLASYYRDYAIAKQNLIEIKKQEQNIKKQQAIMTTLLNNGCSREVFNAQSKVIDSQFEMLNKLKGYRLKNKIRLGLNKLSLIAVTLTTLSFIFPPVGFGLAAAGVVLFTVGVVIKALDKIFDDGIAKLVNRWKDRSKPTPNTDKRLDKSKTNKLKSQPKKAVSYAEPLLPSQTRNRSHSVCKPLAHKPLNAANQNTNYGLNSLFNKNQKQDDDNVDFSHFARTFDSGSISPYLHC